MANANAAKELKITANNEVGTFEKVTSAISGAGVNIKAICAWSEGNKACFVLLTDDNAKAQSALKSKGFSAEEKEVVTLSLKDEIGSAAKIAKKIKDAGIDLSRVYGSSCGCNDASALLVFGTKEPKKLLDCLKS